MSSEFIPAIGEHMVIVLASVAIASALGIGLGILSYWKKSLGTIIITICELIQTIPSLALLAMLMIIFGLGNVTMGSALVLYALLPIVRNTHTALSQLPPALIDAARGMGMSRSQRLVKVEIPLSIPMIFGGIKVALVNSLSIAVMGVLIGAGGLGYIVYRGIQQQNMGRIILGAIPVVIGALLFDWLLGNVEKRLAKHARL